MKQTVEEAAREFSDYNGCMPNASHSIIKQSHQLAFIRGAEWQAKQSPWTLVGDRSNPAPIDKPCLLLLGDGSVVEYDSNWEDKCLSVVAWMLKPSFDQILEANKDVLQRMKEKGD